ncbi:dihydrofolate reductase [Niallia circulans]|jgi:dihydrofolate reductase|uniref:dihydrofolate reductase n=1 Tax=Shouchella clausii TaxID=79880 RepID=UPI000BA63417|nr:dihydrofolate reductase [Shouchella clausii]PAF16544.1 dihydrofolate reductase [Shouchella clausii]SPT80712.1 dihydrofolate reductase [Niallia circulans]
MIVFVYARDAHYGIGKDNGLPWHLPADLRHFKRTTTGKTIVMGRKTFDSMGGPLPNRKNVVLTRSRSFQAEGAEVIHSPDDVLQLSKQEAIYVIGGAEIFALLWDICDKHIVTVIDEKFEADTFVPPLSEQEWELVETVPGPIDEKNRYPHEYRTYVRKQAK